MKKPNLTLFISLVFCAETLGVNLFLKRVWGCCYSKAIRNLIPKHKRRQAGHQFVRIPSSAVAKTTRIHASAAITNLLPQWAESPMMA